MAARDMRGRGNLSDTCPAVAEPRCSPCCRMAEVPDPGYGLTQPWPPRQQHSLVQDIGLFLLFTFMPFIYAFFFFLRKRREHGRASSLRASSSGQSHTSPRVARKVSDD